MARATKKKKELTIEEKLAEALVPESKQPYPVPENWCWTSLSQVLIPSKEKTEDFSNLSTKYIGLENMEKDSGIISFGSVEGVKSTKNIFSEGQILYGKLRPYLNKHGIAEFDGVCSTDILVFDTKDTTFNKFINYYFDQQHFIEYAISNSKGINLPRVSESIVLNAKCPLPPLPEQQRIVARIESLFSKLDEAKDKAQAVVDGFEDRKAAILHKAFTGELTAGWRTKNSVAYSDWKTNVLEEHFDIVGGIQKKPSRTPKNNPVPYITVANVYRDRIDLSDLRYFEVFEGELEKLQLKYADILIVEGNGSGNEIGRCAMWRDELPICIHQNHIIRIRRKDDSVLPEYVLYYLNSSSGKDIMKERAKTTAGLYNLSTGKIKTIPVPLAPINEQREIVCILDKMIEIEQQAKDTAEQVISQIDTMKKSILARAFRGELGTNDPADESAIELLKRVLGNE